MNFVPADIVSKTEHLLFLKSTFLSSLFSLHSQSHDFCLNIVQAINNGHLLPAIWVWALSRQEGLFHNLGRFALSSKCQDAHGWQSQPGEKDIKTQKGFETEKASP